MKNEQGGSGNTPENQPGVVTDALLIHKLKACNDAHARVIREIEERVMEPGGYVELPIRVRVWHECWTTVARLAEVRGVSFDAVVSELVEGAVNSTRDELAEADLTKVAMAGN